MSACRSTGMIRYWSSRCVCTSFRIFVRSSMLVDASYFFIGSSISGMQMPEKAPLQSAFSRIRAAASPGEPESWITSPLRRSGPGSSAS